MRPRTTWGLAMFHGNLVCHFFFLNFFQGGLINFEKRRKVSRDLGCDFPFSLGMSKAQKWGLQFFVEVEKMN